MITALVSRLIILGFGTLYPAYASFKAVKSKDLKEYVKWMMYWIIFAIFTSAEVFADVFLSFWFPFYYELKVIIVLWLMSPMTKGASILYKNFVHPLLSKKEKDIDLYITTAKDQGYNAIIEIGSKGVSMATNVIMTTAIKRTYPALSSDNQTLQQPIQSNSSYEMTNSYPYQQQEDRYEDEFAAPKPRRGRPKRSKSRASSTSRSRGRNTRQNDVN